MKALKRLGSFLLALVMVLSMIPATHTHAAEVTSGYCGDPGTNGGKDVSWTFQDGVLTISGTGKTQTYASANKNLGSVASIDYTPARPWTAKSITKAVVEEGVTKIGGVFYNAYNMTEVSLPDSLTVIGDCSFEDCIGLESITIPKNVTDIWVYAFGGCENLTSITFTGDAPSFDVDVFKGVTATCYYPTSANWPADTLKDYGGSLTWVAYDPCAGGHSFGEDDACTVCGKSNKHNHGEAVYTLWNSPAELPGSAGHYALEHDIVLTQSWTAPAGETVLCLNGHSISGNFTKTVGSGSTLTLCDCADTPGTVSAASSSALNSFLVETGGVLNISQVQITVSSGKSFSDSSVNVTAVRNNGGTVHMDSGEIRAEIGDWASEGAYVHGICNVSGTVHISGGTLYAYAQSHGAGTGIRYEAYCLNNSGTANITGGTFTAELGADTGPTNKYAYAISNSFSETSRVNLGGNPQLSGEVCMQRHNTYSAKVGDLPYTGAALQFTWRPYSSMRSYDIVVRDVTQDNQHLFTMADAAGVSMDLAHVGNHLVYDNGQPHTHTWTGDCEAVRVCSVCEYSDGVTPGHDWLDATCTAPKTCSVCGETEGETTNHSYDGGVCTACGNVQKAVTITSAGGKQTEYDTLEEAAKAAADGDTITLNAHVKIKKALTFSSGNITLDLNKHMLDVAEGCLYDVPIVNIQGATLTITGSNVVWDDSSEDHNHTVNDASCNVSVFSGKLILDHAKVYACCKEYAIVVHAGASAELKGADCSKVKIYGTVTVTDSTVSYLYTSEGTAYVESGKCYLFNAGTAYIRGGTVTGALNYNNCLMEISGGTVSGIENYGHMMIQDDAVITGKMLVTVSGTAAISGGTFTGGIALSQNYKKLSDLLEEGYVYYDGTSAYGPTHPLLATQELTGDPDITVIPAEDTIVASRTDPDGTVTNYVSVEEALLAGTEGTVTLLADATLGYNVSVGITENLDLNGKKLTVPEDHTLKVYGILMMNGGSVSGAYSFGTNSGGLGGSCGENAWWKLEQGVLTIYGSGEMTSAPWPKENITTTIIEEGITSICEGAFKDCEKMTAVTIPNTVTKLGSSCFDGCEMLASVDLPEGITAIPSSAFAYCWALTGIEVPESVTSIGYKAFAYCREMVGMQIPEKVTSIGSDAFTGCNKLKFVRFNGNAPTLGSYAFRSLTLKAFYPGYDTTWTADVRKPYGGSVTWVAYDQNHLEHSFDSNGVCSCGCIGSTCGQNALWALDPATGTLYISGTGKMEDYDSSSYTPWANYKNAVRKVVVEEGITHVGDCAFKEFSNLETVSLPDSLTSIGSEAIMLCPKLKEIEIPENVTKIGVYAFEQCYGLESVVLPEGLSTISSGLFNTCISLKSVTIPASVTAIGTSAFNGCNSLADVYYGSNEKAWNQISIGSYNNPLLSATIHYTDPCLQGHTWKNADCVAPKTCTVCGETEGEALGHSWVDADCVNPKTCTVCGETEGEALGHSWVDADCVNPKTCKVCGKTEGEALGHDWLDADCVNPKTCKVCGETEGEALGHDWLDADCVNPKTCKVCGETEGEALGHSWVDADCVNPKTCTVCGETEGEALGHSWVDADCVNPKTCTVCGETEGEALGHDWVDADCETAKTCKVCGETEGEALGHDWVDADCVNPKTCKVCGATEGKALGHSWVDADCVNPKTCKVCGKTEGEALGHSWQDASCVAPKSCRNCDATQGEKKPRAHKFTEENKCQYCDIAGGRCGSYAYWTRSDGVLTIYGYGEMWHYDVDSYTYAPWHTGCSVIESIVVEEGITTIGNDAFYNCWKATSVSLPASLTKIGTSAFSKCAGLTNVFIADLDLWLDVNLASVSSSPWWESNQATLHIDGVETTDLVIPDGTDKILDNTFYNCAALQTISIPQSVTSIGTGAFHNATSVTQLTLSEGVRVIGDAAFSGCSQLTEVWIPNSVTSIGRAFYNCSGLKEIVIPETVEHINASAFGGAALPEDIYYGGTAQKWATIGVMIPKTTRVHPECKDPSDHWIDQSAEPTCTSEGYTYQSCSCGFLRNKQITAKPIKHTYDQAVIAIETLMLDATCTEAAVYYYSCKCGKISTSETDTFTDGTPLGHDWQDADCETAKTCKVCGETEGEALGHSWVDADCVNPKTCKVCGETEGEALGHSWVDADCVNPKTCKVCGEIEGVALGHDWQDADCETAKTCKVCGETEGVALGHSWQDADCETAKTCKVCGETEGEALGHSWVDADYVNPKTCKVCGETEGEALGHSWVDADCVNPKTCKVCGEIEGEALGHSWVDADCVNPKTCKGCGEIEGEALGHSWVDADCVNPKTCKVCGETEGVALGHDWQDADCETAKTCKACGETEGVALGHDWQDADCVNPKTCKVCGETEGVALGHDWQDADCETAKACKVCGETEGEALGHSWVAADCDTAKTCSVCGATEGNPLGHTVVTDKAVEATCTATGLTEGQHCSACGEVLVAPQTVPTKNHTWKSATCVAPQTCTVCGQTNGDAKGHEWKAATCTENAVCKRCGEVAYGTKLPHAEAVVSAVAATCTSVGKTEGKYCTICGTVTKTQQTIPALGHTEVIDPAVEATCTTIGKTEGSHCSVCGTVIAAQQTIHAKGHAAVPDAAVAATCTTPGKTSGSHCKICGEVIMAQVVIPATGHSWQDGNCYTPKTCKVCGVKEGGVVHAYEHRYDYKCDLCGVERIVDMTRPMVDMFRMYNPNTGEHFYTGSTVERDNLVAVGWQYEGVGFTFPLTTGKPVHRLFDPITGEHLYTMDENEKAMLEAKGWNYEGIAFNSGFENEVPQYRLHNPNATVGAYHFTASAEERDTLLAAGWEYQGIGWYSLGA